MTVLALDRRASVAAETRRDAPAPGGFIGADTDLMRTAARGGARQHDTLVDVGMDLRRAVHRHADSGSSIRGGPAASGLDRVAAAVARHDRWVTELARAIAEADSWPRAVGRTVLDRLRGGPPGIADAAVLATARAAADGAAPRAAHTAALDEAGLRALAAALPVGGAASDAVAREVLRRRRHAVEVALAAATSAAGDPDDDGPVERLLRRLDATDGARGIEWVLDPLPTVDDEVRRLATRRDGITALLEEPDVRLAAAQVGDPLEGGLVLVVRGDLDTADHVAVLVPGTGTGISTPWGALRDQRSLHGATGPSAATVAWIHDAPTDLPAAADPRHADRLSAALARAVDQLVAVAPVDARVTVLGHSHGAVVATAAAAGGLAAHDLVLLGPPGLGPHGIDEIHAGLQGGGVHVAMAPDDPVRFVPLLGRLVDGAGHGPAAETVAGVVRLPTDAPVDPASRDRPVVGPAPTRGHDDYLRPGPTLTAVAALVRGGSPAGATGPPTRPGASTGPARHGRPPQHHGRGLT